jgi:hypothetical protein
MTTPPLPGGPLATIRQALYRDDIDHGPAFTALDQLSELVRRAQQLTAKPIDLHDGPEDPMAFTAAFSLLKRALLPFETSTEEGPSA